MGDSSLNAFGFSLLSSGSKANSTLITDSECGFLIDAGLSCRRTEQRLLELGYSIDELAGIVLTHEHSDHVVGLKTIIKKYRPDIFTTSKTAEACDILDYDKLCCVSSSETFSIGNFSLDTFPVWHDAAEPIGMVVSKGEYRLGYCTDTGRVCENMKSRLKDLSALVIESNHDLGLLGEAPYPDRLKNRIAGDFGHLGNLAAADLLRGMAKEDERLQFIIAAHISENSNTPVIALQELEQAWAASGGWKDSKFFAATAAAATPFFQIRSALGSTVSSASSSQTLLEDDGAIDLEGSESNVGANSKMREIA